MLIWTILCASIWLLIPRLFNHVNVAASVKNLLDEQAHEPALNVFQDDHPIQGRSYFVELSINF